jgi:Dyp-type peroxidase family
VKRSGKVDWADTQGLILSGYSQLPFAAYLPWRFADSVTDASKAWLNDLANRLARSGSGTGGGVAVNFALTSSGVKKLTTEEEQFSLEFREGMTHSPRRRSILGDVGKNSPESWQWGGLNANGKIDGMLLLFAASENSLNKLIHDEMERMRGVEFLEAASGDQTDKLILQGALIRDPRSFNKVGSDIFKEHFGFTDGISQPVIAGSATSKERKLTTYRQMQIHTVRPGEFVLGYRNERGDLAGYSGIPSRGSKAKSNDLLRNGTYLVFRQLEQNVPAFDSAVQNAAECIFGDASKENQWWVASRMMGRTIDGDPSVLLSTGCPNSEAKRQAVSNQNDFLYYFDDRFGLRCPLGAHIRRANPRDSLGPNPESALRLSKMHRIIRRGRPYGKPFVPFGEPGREGNEPRGMQFICLNADIAGQFELIQHSWINNGRFNGLYAETDPIFNYPGEDRLMTIQSQPTSEGLDRHQRASSSVGGTKAISSFEQFVSVRGGAYFFLPGIRAMRSLVG